MGMKMHWILGIGTRFKNESFRKVLYKYSICTVIYSGFLNVHCILSVQNCTVLLLNYT